MFLLADKITNLTAARYFAARGAEWLFFDPSSISIPEIQAIRGWVEGPQAGLYLPLGSESMDGEILEQIQPDGVMLGHFADRKALVQGIPFVKEWRLERGDNPIALLGWMQDWPEAEAHLVRLDDWHREEVRTLVPSLSTDRPVIISIPPRVLRPIIEEVRDLAGICFVAPPEEEVGLVSFEELDDAIDAMEDYLS